MKFAPEDIIQIQQRGMLPERIREQLELFARGISYVELHRPCTLGDGIETIPEQEEAALIDGYEQAAAAGRCLKFVPASGAASRMFKEWFKGLERPGLPTETAARTFAEQLPLYPFYDDLCKAASRDGRDIAAFLQAGDFAAILSYILTSRGLDYGKLPKALLKFHKYPWGSRTALEEHLVEAARYAVDGRRISRLHITLSPEHRQPVEEFLAKVRTKYEKAYGVIYEIGISCQEKATDTIAVDLENRPLRDDNGRLCFRPGGHGALLQNLNALDGDIIFLKNIDNVSPEGMLDLTVRFKKLLAGLLLKRQEETFRYLEKLHSGKIDQEDLAAIDLFCRQKLHIGFPQGYARWSREEKLAAWRKKLSRPLRVCGVVRNESEPGGGPFWVRDDDDGQSLQIVEEVQVDCRNGDQRARWRAATHFNPVDLVCAVRDFQGKKFDLEKYVDPRAFSIARKSDHGRDLQALELPGLWNGAMANWNTIFVEVPLATFNPVKMVEDLLRPQHLS
ncbi:MAG: DUF4301 family protein [Syntrophobacterales bacterium]|nr:DUF4301 family protein [Syntrophobacterales bacterium]